MEDTGTEASPYASFKDKLMQSTLAREVDLNGDTVDIEMGEDDVEIRLDGTIPSISFLKKVQDQLTKPWQRSVVVKLLGRYIGYNTFMSMLETMWSDSKGFSVIDLEKDYFLVKFQEETDVVDVLTKVPWVVLGHYLSVQP